MLAKRIIPCLDVLNGRTVKGVNFLNLRDAGDVTELAEKYSRDGADELVFLDITASYEQRQTMLQWVERVACAINIPFTVGGGVRSEKDAEQLLKKGADKVSVNSAALETPELLNRLSYHFGKQCIVLAVDAKETGGEWRVYSKGGRVDTGRDLFAWVAEAETRGCGEILFTSMNHDGTNSGFACDALARMAAQVAIPVIASGGAGSKEDFYRVFTAGKADAALAAGVFHYGKMTVGELKDYLHHQGIEIRK
jgi:cyclase